MLLLEPFVLPYPADRKQWRKDLDPKIHSIRELAAEFGCDYLPLDGLFAERTVKNIHLIILGKMVSIQQSPDMV